MEASFSILMAEAKRRHGLNRRDCRCRTHGDISAWCQSCLLNELVAIVEAQVCPHDGTTAARTRDLENAVCRLEFERDLARKERAALMAAIKPLLFAPATRNERRMMDWANAAIALVEHGTPLPRDLAAAAKEVN